MCWIFGSPRLCGVAILYRPCFSASTVSAFDGHFVLPEFTFCDTVFRVACCYAPNRNPDRDIFLTRCGDSIDPSIPTLLCGDFNIDCHGSCPFDSSRESSSLLSSLFLECCVVDIWRLLHPSVSAFSWSRRDNSLASRIDLIGCPYLWIPYVSVAEILPCPFSDHSALSFGWTFSSASPPGPGLWKLNTAILEDVEYFNLISNFWSTWQSRRRSFSSLTEWWDQGKSRIKGLTINYCKARGRSCVASVREDLLTNVSSVLPSDQSCLCEGLLSQDECYLALQGMARGKAPGCDGLPMEFYLKFWSVLGSDLVSVLNSAIFAGVLSRSQRRGVITLSFKKGDRLDPCNWRPY